MSDLKIIRDYLATQIASIPEVGIVHDYHRYSTNLTDLKNLCKYRDSIRVWMITREAAPATPAADDEQADGGNVYRVTHVFLIRGYTQVEDGQASELTHHDLCEQIVEKLDGDYSLGKNAPFGSSPVSLRRTNHVMFAGVLCHHSELVLEVYEVRARV